MQRMILGTSGLSSSRRAIFATAAFVSVFSAATLTAAPCLAQEYAPNPPLVYSNPVGAAPVAPAPVVVPERTEVKLILKQRLKSGETKKNAEVVFAVAQDVYSAERALLITAGTPAYGTVTESKRRGMLGKGGKLGFTCDYVRLPDGTKIPLRGDSVGVAGKNNQNGVLGAAILVTPFAVFINGRDVTVDEGKEFTMIVAQDTAIRTPLATKTLLVAPAPQLVPYPTAPQQPQQSYAPASPFDARAAARPAVNYARGGEEVAPRYLAPAPQPEEAPAPPRKPATRFLFELKKGPSVVGSIVDVDGGDFIIQTRKGVVRIKAANIKRREVL